jgi:3-(3-hydroxy-phenyl)propionate hydroxylase
MPRYSYQALRIHAPPELSGKAAPETLSRRHRRVPGRSGSPWRSTSRCTASPRWCSTTIDVVSVGSRAICWSKRTLEIFDRLGVGERMVEKGVTWKVGRLFHRDREVWSFDLLPEEGHKMPAFINLQQYHVEQYLVERARAFPELIDLRFKNRVTGVSPAADHAAVDIETPDGAYRLKAQYLIACDGARSFVRQAMGLDFAGKLFEERFLIADVEMKADFPSERWFWFEPPFHAGQSALLHKQPDDIYRIDLQLGWDADPEEEKKPENVIPRIEKMIGHSDFELDWVSVYTFQCRRLERFVHGRVIFAGDSGPYRVALRRARRQWRHPGRRQSGLEAGGGAEGRGRSEALLATYDEERIRGADENIANSARSTNFMTPKSPMERGMFRDEVLSLAADFGFARKLVNSGRLSLPCSLDGLSLQTPRDEAPMRAGRACKDAPIEKDGKPGWLLERTGRGVRIADSWGRRPRAGDARPARIRCASARTSRMRRGWWLSPLRQGADLSHPPRPACGGGVR